MERVAIVVDRDFGRKLVGLASQMPVWIVDSPSNRPYVDGCWALAQGDVTRFAARDEDGPEALALAHLADVDLHHEWTELAFLGVGPTDSLRVALGEYGVDRTGATPEGFLATKRQTGARLIKARGCEAEIQKPF